MHAHDTAVSAWTLVPSLLILGLGMGACFSSIYDVAIGDVAPAEAGSASGALSAAQQLASGIGAAVVTSVYFSQQIQHGAAHAMTVSVIVVGAIAALCLGLDWLLPKLPPRRPALTVSASASPDRTWARTGRTALGHFATVRAHAVTSNQAAAFFLAADAFFLAAAALFSAAVALFSAAVTFFSAAFLAAAAFRSAARAVAVGFIGAPPSSQSAIFDAILTIR